MLPVSISVPHRQDALREMEPVRIAGRMEHFKDTRSNTIAIVDYAHNYASVTALLDYVDQRYGSESRKSRSSPAPLETRHTIAAPKSSTPRRTASTISCSLSKTPTTSLWNRSART